MSRPGNFALLSINEFHFCNNIKSNFAVRQLRTQPRQSTVYGMQRNALTGDLKQGEREGVVAKFREGNLRVLIATDIAGRGLDVKNIDLVVNYDAPQTVLDYVHRVGRTGRAGAKGTAVSLAMVHETSNGSLDVKCSIGPLDIKCSIGPLDIKCLIWSIRYHMLDWHIKRLMDH